MGALSDVRELVAAAVADALPDAVAIPYGDTVDTVEVVTTVTVLSAVLEADVACPYRRAAVDVYVIVPPLTPGVDTPDLEDAVDAVLEALRALPRTLVKTAERSVLGNRYPAFTITTEAQL